MASCGQGWDGGDEWDWTGHSPWFASLEPKVARMTVQVPIIPSGPVVQPCARVAGGGSQERGHIIATLKTSLEHPRGSGFPLEGCNSS